MQAYNKKREDQVRETDLLNWYLGRYVAYGFNDPKHYPDKPILYKEQKVEQKIMSAEEMEAMVRRNNIILKGKVK